MTIRERRPVTARPTHSSLHPGSDLPLAAGGTAAVLAGLGITLVTLRRRRGSIS